MDKGDEVRELNLAIEIWQEIKDNLHTGSIRRFKTRFFTLYNINWKRDCVFCEYYNCDDCPLAKRYGDCRCTDNPFHKLIKMKANRSFMHWNEECDKIIEVLKEESTKCLLADINMPSLIAFLQKKGIN